jgi:TonB family protein
VPATPPATAESAPPSELDSLLTIARARLARGQLVNPPGDSALAYLERATRIDAADSGVLAARAELGGALAELARAAASADDLDAAESLADDARELGASVAALAAVDASITSARNARTARTQQRHAAIAATVRARLASDALLAPPGDGAVDHLNALQAEGATLDELPALWRAFTAALATKARDAVARRDWSGAQGWLAALERTGRDVGTAETLARQITTGRLQDEYLASAAPASELTLLSSPPADYPREAQLRGVEGWVDLEFIVDRNGAVRDAAVTEAQPERRFNDAALAAVAQYRYAPFVRGGQAYERRVRVRIRFTLE